MLQVIHGSSQTKPGGDKNLHRSNKLNQAIIHPMHRWQMVTDILSHLTGVKYFSILDVKSSFWNLKHYYQSSNLITLACMYGIYMYKRLSFGLSWIRDLFQRYIDEIFTGVRQHVVGIADDILVVSFEDDVSDNDQALEAVLKWAQDVSLKLYPDK